jgi:2-hydroxy-3-keto-5-methylthiopentenyl-1-phosphate phosphatase
MTRTAVFIDFDGTISPVDISNTFFTTFAGEDAAAAVEDWKKGLIGSSTCLERELAAFQGDLETLREFAGRQPIDKGFHDLESWCRRGGAGIFIVSDGLDYYIRAFLEAHGLRTPLFSNRLVVGGDGPRLEFPHYNRECGACGNCKSGHVERARDSYGSIIYVGDGLSDRCAVAKADLAFAKGELAAFCRREGIPHIDFESLAEVAGYLETRAAGEPLSRR